MISALQCGTGRHQHNNIIHQHPSADMGGPFLCLPQKIACCPSGPSSGSSERWHTMKVIQDHQHGRQDTPLQLCWPSKCSPASPWETAGRSPKAASGLSLWFKGDDGREQRFALRTLGSAKGTLQWVQPWEQDSGESPGLCSHPGCALNGFGPV